MTTKTASDSKKRNYKQPRFTTSADDSVVSDPGTSRFRVGAFVVSAVIALAVIVVDYLLAIYTAVSVVPNIAVFVQQGTGITVDLRLDAVLAGWLLPVMFLVALVFVAELIVMRALWRAGRRLNASIDRRFFRTKVALG